MDNITDLAGPFAWLALILYTNALLAQVVHELAHAALPLLDQKRDGKRYVIRVRSFRGPFLFRRVNPAGTSWELGLVPGFGEANVTERWQVTYPRRAIAAVLLGPFANILTGLALAIPLVRVFGFYDGYEMAITALLWPTPTGLMWSWMVHMCLISLFAGIGNLVLIVPRKSDGSRLIGLLLRLRRRRPRRSNRAAGRRARAAG